MGDREKEVERLIEREMKPSGITDERVLEAVRAVPREKFLPPSLRDRAYENYPLPIGANQTISQPYIVALMTQALDPRPNCRVLEMGTGSGYQAAILARLCAIVYTIERHAELAGRARTNLYSMGYDNIYIIEGDGTRGLPEYAPYDRIIVTAAAPRVPDPLVEQLAGGGRMVIPVGGRMVQDLKLVEKARNGRLYRSSLGGCRFVPLIGEEGFGT
ncbi:MAG: protein-L-isoaspartate(D-aspartate) O-methyltransferase [Spirochaetota bacterium]